jgi:hypothetical protein
MTDSILSVVNLSVVLLAAVFTYYKFFREGSHQQRIEFDIDCVDLGVSIDSRIVEIGIVATNRGNVEQKFDKILLKVRGILQDQALQEIPNHEPRLSFPETISEISVIPEKYNYFFVRPGVTQRFPVVIKVPEMWCQLHARSTFKYLGTNDMHTAERSFTFAKNNT